MKKIFTTLLSFGMLTTAFAQWSKTQMKGENLRQTNATSFYSVDLKELRTQLAGAQPTGRDSKPVIVNVPTLDGKVEKFAVYSLPVVVQSLADKYELGSYVGTGVDDPEKYIRFSVAPNDFQSMVIKNGVYEFIEPQNKEKSVYGVHPKTDKTSGTNGSWLCDSTEPILTKKQIDKLASGSNFANNPKDFGRSSDQKYRTMRLAMTVNGEYTAFHGGTVAGALTAINATITRCNAVFENDFALHLILQDFPTLIYTNAATDPYSTTLSSWNLSAQKAITAAAGEANYDIGHMFGASGGGGNAGCIGCVCISPPLNTSGVPTANGKGSGITSPADGIPQGDNFDIDYVAHEMGHQLGGNHTFSMGVEGSGQNVEPGTGSTIMGYAGIGAALGYPGSDVQAHSDPYFHINSIIQVQTNLTAKTCDIETPITNQPPVVTAMADVTIPKGTAFVLTAQATDPENNPITYTWEQTDSALTGSSTVNANSTTGPLFRSWVGSANPLRYFPKLSTVLAGNLSSVADFESVSNVARTTNFKVTVRDNNPAVAQQQTQYGSQRVVVGAAGPFKVTSTKVYNNAVGPFTWDVVGTNVAPYNVTNVKIDYTTDNGTTWTVLAASTPNDGSENFDFAAFATNSQMTVRVSAIGNVFYAVGKVTVSAMVACDGTAPAGLAVSGLTQTGAKADWEAVANATYVLRYKKASETSWTQVNNLATNSYTFTQLEEDTNYNVQVATICSGTTGTFSASVNFKTLGLVYCPVTSSNAADEYISKVVVTPANNGTVMTSTSGASTYTSYAADNTKLVQLTKGSTGNTVAVTKAWTGATYSEGVAVWIDFNRNGTYEDSEKVMTSTPSTTPIATATFDVPTTAYSGDKTMGMRVILQYNASPAGPCTSYTYGEVEDYSVKITDNLAVSDVKKNNISVYPNPAVDVINISNVSSKTKFEIYSVGGQLVNQGTTDGKVNVSKLTKGVYILSLESNGEKSQTKFIKN